VSITVRVPASTANLGPGFDALGLALALHDEIEVEVTPAGLAIDVEGEGESTVPRDESHLVVRALRVTLDALGAPQPAGLLLRCRNHIPHARGLGSSAAAVVAGVAAGYALAGVELNGARRAGDALHLAASFEGHADNAAASLLGGLVVTWSGEVSSEHGKASSKRRDALGEPAGQFHVPASGQFHAVRLEPHPNLSPMLLVPATTSATEVARGLLPSHIPLGDAVFNVGRAALAVLALTKRPELLLAATDDRLHQPYRRPAHPDTAALVDVLRGHGVPAAVSGAGPTVLALTAGEPLPPAVDLTGFEARPLRVELAGVRTFSVVRDGNTGGS
jgi:homoserine kinase